jgi:hypothetical protein
MWPFTRNSLDPKNFENIQDFFTKFKSLLCELKDRGIEKSKEEKQLILSIMEKLRGGCSMDVRY